MNTPSNLRALVAEDEPILAAALLQALQRLWPELQVIASVDNGQAVVEQTLKQRPDILFLDIKMPGKSGLEAAQELAEEWPENEAFPLIVFVTAYDEYVISAFEHAAASGDGYWVRHFMLDNPSGADCIYCRLFPGHKH